MNTIEKKALFEDVLQACETIISSSDKDRDEKLLDICKILHEKIAYFDWVGFYLVNPNNSKELILGPYVGEPTEHVKIPFGKGICGQAAESGKTFVVQDVSKETNYLSCSPKVKSEIVVPLFKQGNIIGELDIDSHQLSPFTSEDQEYLERICERIANSLF